MTPEEQYIEKIEQMVDRIRNHEKFSQAKKGALLELLAEMEETIKKDDDLKVFEMAFQWNRFFKIIQSPGPNFPKGGISLQGEESLIRPNNGESIIHPDWMHKK